MGIAKDMGLDFSITVSADSSAVKEIATSQTSGDQDAVGAGQDR